MSDLQDLYQEVILDHNKRPRNRRRIDAPCRHAEGYNPLCGDHVTVYVRVEDDRVVDAGFEGSGCAISTASASLMTERLKGRSVAEARELFEKFHNLLAGEVRDDGPELGKLAVFAGVRQYPVRVKCATLAWHTLKAALEDKAGEVVSTE